MSIAMGIVLAVVATVVALNFMFIVMSCLSGFVKGVQVLLEKSTAVSGQRHRPLREAKAT